MSFGGDKWDRTADLLNAMSVSHGHNEFICIIWTKLAYNQRIIIHYVISGTLCFVVIQVLFKLKVYRETGVFRPVPRCRSKERTKQ